jgi:glycosyltransferase involved in cell wall biosynthesis
MSPEVTVLLAVNDGADYIGDAIDSVLAQTFDDFELLIVDDASNDETMNVVRSFDDPRIRVLRNERNLGQVPSLNRGLHEARGAIVARLDHDDVSRPDRLERQVEVLRREPRVGLVGAWAELVDGDDRTIGVVDGHIASRVDFVYWTLLQYVLIPHPAAAFRRDAVIALGGYDETLGPAEDKDLWRKLLLAGWDARVVEEPLVRYRVHEAQLSQTRAELQRRNDDRSQDALLAQLAPGAPVARLRGLLAGDPFMWRDLRREDDLPRALDALLAGAASRLELDAGELYELRERIADRVAEVTRSGWRARGRGWHRAAPGLVDWAGRRPRAFTAIHLLAPVLRPLGRMLALVTHALAHAPGLGVVRARLRRSQALRRVYAYVTRRR